ncbi:MAG: hypothetical protein R3228_09165, partial [Halioglobus sp.]|nr:hypothetical protein [Halioglobus sp.]
ALLRWEMLRLCVLALLLLGGAWLTGTVGLAATAVYALLNIGFLLQLARSDEPGDMALAG